MLEIETNQQHRLENLQKSVEADQELDAAHAKQVHAKHEMSILVAEQTAENAKGVNQGTSGIQSRWSFRKALRIRVVRVEAKNPTSSIISWCLHAFGP